MVAINLTGTAALISVFFWFGPDRTPSMLLRWTIFFVATIAFPMHLSARIDAELARLPEPVSPRLRRMAAYPVWVGLFALGAAIALLERLR
jgi:hypothetical protein